MKNILFLGLMFIGFANAHQAPNSPEFITTPDDIFDAETGVLDWSAVHSHDSITDVQYQLWSGETDKILELKVIKVDDDGTFHQLTKSINFKNEVALAASFKKALESGSVTRVIFDADRNWSDNNGFLYRRLWKRASNSESALKYYWIDIAAGEKPRDYDGHGEHSYRVPELRGRLDDQDLQTKLKLRFN